MKRTTLLLADDHSPVLDYLTQMLSNEFEIVGVFGDGQAAFEAAFALKPEAVVFDISMPVLSGLAAADRVATTASRGLPHRPRRSGLCGRGFQRRSVGLRAEAPARHRPDPGDSSGAGWTRIRVALVDARRPGPRASSIGSDSRADLQVRRVAQLQRR
jgi:hypothetical protein